MNLSPLRSRTKVPLVLRIHSDVAYRRKASLGGVQEAALWAAATAPIALRLCLVRSICAQSQPGIRSEPGGNADAWGPPFTIRHSSQTALSIQNMRSPARRAPIRRLLKRCGVLSRSADFGSRRSQPYWPLCGYSTSLF